MNDTTQVGIQKRRAAVVVGRFNPPTVGHYAVFDQAKQFIRENQNLRLDPIVITVVVDGIKTSEDKNRNPLTADERVAFMTGSGLANGVKFLTAKSALDAFYEVRRAGYEPIAVAAGSDRGENYLEMLDKYFKTEDDEPIDHYLIKLDRTEETGEPGIDKDAALDDVLHYTDKDIPTHMVSASLARRAVRNDELDKFSIITGLTSKPTLAKLMFDKIKAATNTMQEID